MNTFSLIPHAERVAVWSIAPEEARSALIEVDAAKHVRILRETVYARKDKISREFLGELRHIPVVVSLHPALAYSAILPFSLNLSGNAREDRLSFQGIVREYVNRGNLETRLEAAKSLAVQDLDAILFDARLMCLKLDGKPVSGWPRLQGKKLEGEVHLLFTTRAVFHELHDILHSRSELFATEENKSALSLLSRVEKGSLRLLDADPQGADIAVMDRRHAPVFRKLPFAWRSPLSLLREEWGISEMVARRILIEAKEAPRSSPMKKLFEKMREASLEGFKKALQKTKFRGTIYFRGKDVLPFDLPEAIDDVGLATYPFREVWDALGFSGLQEVNHEEESVLLPFLEFYYHRGDPAHHRALARQIHWIAP